MQKIVAVAAALLVVASLATLVILDSRAADNPPDSWTDCVRRWDALRAKQCTPENCAKTNDPHCQRCNAADTHLMRIICEEPRSSPAKGFPPRVLDAPTPR